MAASNIATLCDPLQSTNLSALFAADDRLWAGYVFGGFSLVNAFGESIGVVTVPEGAVEPLQAAAVGE